MQLLHPYMSDNNECDVIIVHVIKRKVILGPDGCTQRTRPAGKIHLKM